MKTQTKPPTAKLPSCLEIASRQNSAHLAQLEQSLAVSLDAGRGFGNRQRVPDAWGQEWKGHWDNIERIIERTRAQMNEMMASLDSPVGERLARAMKAWEAIQCEGDFLQEALAQVRAQASQLGAAERENWNTLARTLEYELEAIHYFAQALRLNLELLQGPAQPSAKAARPGKATASSRRSPQSTVKDELYDHEYRRATRQLEQEQHEFLGYMDVVKALLMWEETPEERMTKNRSLQVPPGLSADSFRGAV